MEVIKKNGKVGIQYKREEKTQTPEKFITYAKVNDWKQNKKCLIVANYTPRKKNEAKKMAELLHPDGNIYAYGMRVRVMDNGIYYNQAEVDAQTAKYKRILGA